MWQAQWQPVHLEYAGEYMGLGVRVESPAVGEQVKSGVVSIAGKLVVVDRGKAKMKREVWISNEAEMSSDVLSAATSLIGVLFSPAPKSPPGSWAPNLCLSSEWWKHELDCKSSCSREGLALEQKKPPPTC